MRGAQMESLVKRHELDPAPDQMAYDVCLRCGKPIHVDYLTHLLVTIVGRNAECYGRPA